MTKWICFTSGFAFLYETQKLQDIPCLFFFNEELAHFSLEKLISWQIVYCPSDRVFPLLAAIGIEPVILNTNITSSEISKSYVVI